MDDRNGGGTPASSNRTFVSGSSERRAARIDPAEPPPTVKSVMSAKVNSDQAVEFEWHVSLKI